MVLKENQISISRKGKMKTFKQHINIKETLDGGHVGTPDAASFEDGSIGPHNVQDPEVLKRINAFLGGTAMKEYMTAQHAVEEIRNNLMKIGLFVPNQQADGDKGNFTTEVKFGGGRFGKDTSCGALITSRGGVATCDRAGLRGVVITGVFPSSKAFSKPISLDFEFDTIDI